MRPLSNAIGVDDAPHTRGSGRVLIVGVVTSRTRVDGIVVGHVRRDGRNATQRIAELVSESPFTDHAQVVLLQGITFGGFNVVDLPGLHEMIGRPVIAVVRRRPNLKRIRAALLDQVPGGRRKWELVQRAGPVEPVGGVFVHRAGLSPEEAGRLLASTTQHGKLPEPLRIAHLIAGALATGRSRGGA